MNYSYIVNPITNRKVITDGKVGKMIISNYISMINGGGLVNLKHHTEELKNTARDSAKKHSDQLQKNVIKGSKDVKGVAIKKIKSLANKEFWETIDDETKCEFCANLGETVCKNIYSDKIESIKNLVQEADQLNKMEQMHIKNLNYERASETRDQRVEILKNAHTVNNNLPTNKKVTIPEVPVPANNKE
jgi:hypothetical protein